MGRVGNRHACIKAEGVFQSKLFKGWLAKVGYERVQEIEDPELSSKRARASYKAKVYSDDWIEKRMHGIAIREELTDEWKKKQVIGLYRVVIIYPLHRVSKR